MTMPMRMTTLAATAGLWLLTACTTGTGAGSAGEVQRLRAQADAWDRAIVAKQRDAVAANMAADFVQIGSDGRRADRQAFLDAILSPDLVLQPYTVEDFAVRFHGSTALVTGRTDMTGTYKGRPFRTHYRFTDVYVKQGGVWRVVNVQTTEIAD